MKYSDLNRFTPSELKNLTYGQLSLDKFDLLEKVKSGEINLSNNASQKLFDLCSETVHKYESVSGEKVNFIPPPDKFNMSIKDKLTCISTVINIYDKVSTNPYLKGLLSDVLKQISDFIRNHVN